MTEPIALEAVKRMYNALMAIGALDPLYWKGAAFNKAQLIANKCIREMNVEHTQLIAKAIGLEGKRG